MLRFRDTRVITMIGLNLIKCIEIFVDIKLNTDIKQSNIYTHASKIFFLYIASHIIHIIKFTH